jgi:type VI secretion system protein VasG
LFGGEQNLIQFNMNEFQESHTVSTLKGAPPGYVGYGKGGRLTEAVRKKPYSVLLLDEFDRAHPDVHEIFYQVFDKGWMEDGEGRRINFRNCLILLTSNLGEVEITQACQNDPAISQSQLVKLVHARLSQKFPPALVGRMEVTAYRPLSLQALTAIAAQALIEVGDRIADLGLAWIVTEDVAPWVGQAVITHPSSARAVRDFLRQQVVPPIARALLKAQADNQSLSGIRIFVDQKLCLDFDYKVELTEESICG